LINNGCLVQWLNGKGNADQEREDITTGKIFEGQQEQYSNEPTTRVCSSAKQRTFRAGVHRGDQVGAVALRYFRLVDPRRTAATRVDNKTHEQRLGQWVEM
jgi:hypothetical protein